MRTVLRCLTVVVMAGWYLTPVWMPESWSERIAGSCPVERHDMWDRLHYEWSPEDVKWYIELRDGDIPDWMRFLVREYGLEDFLESHGPKQ